MTIESVTFHALEKSAHLVVFGAVHGNEPCGTIAIRRVIAALQSGGLELARGRVTFVPICNPRAYAAEVRFTERNLNRHFYPKATRHAYEDRLDPILCGLLDDADVLLDLHSYQSEGEAFCFLGTKSQAEIDYARALGVGVYIYGWADAFSKDATKEQQLASLGTTDYARNKAKPALAVTLECGSHDDPQAPEVGYRGILRALIHLGLMDAVTLPPIAQESQRCIRMHSVFYKEKAGAFTQPWRHGQRVKAGEVLARYDDGDTITAPEDGVLVLPKSTPDFAVGAEWCYFGVETPFPVGV